MAAYATQTDLERAAGGADRLVQLADLDANGAGDAAVLSAVIADVERWIDSYLQRRYAVPLATVPEVIRRLCAEESVYQLKAGRSAVDQQAQARHEENLRWLEQVAAGAVAPGVDPPPPKSTSVQPESGDRSEVAGAVTRASTEGFW